MESNSFCGDKVFSYCLFDLTEKIVAARKLPVTKNQIEQARTNTERRAVKLDPPLWVGINYETQVIEGSVLYLYPDVYKRRKNDLASLRNKLDGKCHLLMRWSKSRMRKWNYVNTT